MTRQPPVRLAESVVVDYRPVDQGGGLYIEGVRLPFHVGPDVEVNDNEGMIGSVTLTLYADNVELVSKAGKRTYPVQALLRNVLPHARREARRIVLEGMADILEATWKSDATLHKQLESLPTRYLLGLDEGTRQALASDPTHSVSEHPTEGDNQ